MKHFFTVLFMQISFLLLSQTVDSTKKVWQFHGNIQVNNNGISPVPAFSLGKPALMTSLFLTKGRFTYSPEFNYGSDGKPWVVNQWFRYQWTQGKWAYRTGLNFSLFFLLCSMRVYTFESVIFWIYDMLLNLAVALFIIYRTRYMERWTTRVKLFFSSILAFYSKI